MCSLIAKWKDDREEFGTARWRSWLIGGFSAVAVILIAVFYLFIFKCLKMACLYPKKVQNSEEVEYTLKKNNKKGETE
jgi:hypothetical protein